MYLIVIYDTSFYFVLLCHRWPPHCLKFVGPVSFRFFSRDVKILDFLLYVRKIQEEKCLVRIVMSKVIIRPILRDTTSLLLFSSHRNVHLQVKRECVQLTSDHSRREVHNRVNRPKTTVGLWSSGHVSLYGPLLSRGKITKWKSKCPLEVHTKGSRSGSHAVHCGGWESLRVGSASLTTTLLSSLKRPRF